MSQKGIRTFRDQERLERGRSVLSELVREIEGSISTWCLGELVNIIECKEKKNLKVLPIFHHGDPSDVGNQTGAFADAFAKHEERFKDSIDLCRLALNLGRLALTKAANLAGFHLNYSDRESQLIHSFSESLSHLIPQDGSTNWNLPPTYDATPDESDDADDDDADEMVPDNVADLPLIGLENESLSNLSNEGVQVITNFIEPVSNWMPEDGSTNWNLSPRFDVTLDESDDADDDVDEMVQDNVADLPLIGLENESLSNLSNERVQVITNFIEPVSNWMPEDGSTNWNLSPRFDATPDESDDADDDVDEMVQDNVADLPLELPPRYDDYINDAVDVMQEAHVVLDDVADAPQACPICVTNARNMAFLCGHTTCVECGERLDTCHVCREPISRRIRLFLG